MTKLRVYLEPNFTKADSGEGGIRRVVEAQRKYLPEFGVELEDDIKQADLTAGHGGARPLHAGLPFVCHSHGLYWSDYPWPDHQDNANRRVIDSLLCADAITVPSRWVRNAYVRGILRDPHVIYHGVELNEWTPQQPAGYVLWNKPRQDSVSDAGDLMKLARQMPDLSFVSTLGGVLPNVRLVGRLPYDKMKGLIQSANVYLATARETFGIGTLEALASGVPVAGWNYGGQREIIIQGETGYLAEPGNYAELAECVRKCLAERERLSANAHADAGKRWGWLDKIEQYAALYQCVLHGREARPKVSVVVTCHDLAKYLPDALQSVKAQTFADWECIIVDDASKDQTPQVAGEWVKGSSQFKYLRSEENLKLSRARNFGLAEARGRYCINLDADDVLTPKALEILVAALDRNPHLHIVYGGLDLLSEDGKSRTPNAFPGPFDYLSQMAHLNQLYYAALMRREVWEQAGGYRERLWRAEDAEFWCRATSYGFRAAKVTDEVCIAWRVRADGKSATERKNYPDVDGDWTADFPWAIAHSAKEGIEKKKAGGLGVANIATLPFGAPIQNAPIWHREHPLVSIIIPLGPGHERYVIDALDSCIAQTETNWEVIVVDDTGTGIRSIPGAPYSRLVATGERSGPGKARNLGLLAARAPLVLFLDADDVLAPDALAKMLAEYRKGKAGYVYSGWKILPPNQPAIEMPAQPYNREAWLIGKNEGRNIVSVLMATEDARKIGFDEGMFAYEDWDFFCKCAIAGVCGAPIPDYLVTYRAFAGGRSVSAREKHTELVQLIRGRYQDYLRGAKEMAKCCGGNQKAVDAILKARGMVQTETVAPENTTRMRFMGDRRGPVTYYVKGRPYTGANSDEWRFVYARNEDVQALLNMGVWVKAERETPAVAVSQPVAIPEPPAAIAEPKVAPVAQPKSPPPQVVPVLSKPVTAVQVPAPVQAVQAPAPVESVKPTKARKIGRHR